MKRYDWIGVLVLLALAACDAITHEARRIVKYAEYWMGKMLYNEGNKKMRRILSVFSLFG